MKGLDGIQGPMFVGTGCVFRRKAFYGYDAPKPYKAPTKTCNCWSNGCFGGFCLRRKKKKQLVKQPKVEMMKTRYTKQGGVVPLPLMFTAVDDTEEGVCIESLYNFLSLKYKFDNLTLEIMK